MPREVKRNVYTLVIDHETDSDTTDDVLNSLGNLNDLLRTLCQNEKVHRADYDIDLWEDVTDEYK